MIPRHFKLAYPIISIRLIQYINFIILSILNLPIWIFHSKEEQKIVHLGLKLCYRRLHDMWEGTLHYGYVFQLKSTVRSAQCITVNTNFYNPYWSLRQMFPFKDIGLITTIWLKFFLNI